MPDQTELIAGMGGILQELIGKVARLERQNQQQAVALRILYDVADVRGSLLKPFMDRIKVSDPVFPEKYYTIDDIYRAFGFPPYQESEQPAKREQKETMT